MPGWIVLALLPPAALRAEDAIDWTRAPLLPRDLNFDGDGPANASAARNRAIHLFRITPAFLSEPVGLSDADDPMLGAAAGDLPAASTTDAAPDWLTVTMGNDNPFFDLRRPGDPGGVGFYRVHSQVQLLDSAHTGCALALQAVTPAGRENDGLEDGPTVVSPMFSLYHALDDGTAVQGFVGKHVNLNSRWTNELNQSVQYGMAVQHPVIESRPDSFGNVYVFAEVLGRYRYDAATTAAGSTGDWEVLPGVHWQLAPNWWMSGGVVVPMTSATRTESSQWQITCSFQF